MNPIQNVGFSASIEASKAINLGAKVQSGFLMIFKLYYNKNFIYLIIKIMKKAVVKKTVNNSATQTNPGLKIENAGLNPWHGEDTGHS